NACGPRVDRRMAARRAPNRRRAKLPLELGGERHCAGAATGAAHGDENILLLLLVEIGPVKQLSRLLLEQRVQRERAMRNLVLGRPLGSRLGLLLCGGTTDFAASRIARQCRCPPVNADSELAPSGAAFPPTRTAHDTI